MMLTIHGLPSTVKYHDLKVLIKQECNITDFILDNLVVENGGTKKVRIGVSDDREGGYLMKSLDGFRFSGNVLRVLPVGKPLLNPPQSFDQRGGGGYPPRNDYPNQPQAYGAMEPMTRPNLMGRPDTMGRPDPMSGRQDTMHNRQELSGRSDTMHSRPDAIHSRPNTMHSRPDTMHSRPDTMHSRPDTMHIRPDTMHSRPDTMHNRPDTLTGKPDAIHNRPSAMSARPDPLHGRQDAIHNRMDATHGRSDTMHSRSDSMHSRSESLLGRPDGRPDPMPSIPDPWSTTGTQWGSNQGPSQLHVQNNYNYQQKPLINTYGQQAPPGRQEMRPFDHQDQYSRASGPPQEQDYGFPPKNDVNDPTDRNRNLRSVEIVDEPLNRPIVNSRYPNHGYDGQKPITIMKDNFQGPQYNLDRQAAISGQSSYTAQGAVGHPVPAHGQPSPWMQQMPTAKPSPTYDRKYPEVEKRPISKNIPETSRSHEAYKDYDKGPRFSPRRDSPGRRVSPRRRVSPGRKLSPGRRGSPGDRRLSRRESPTRRLASPPGKRSPPGRRSPARRDSPARGVRYSPSRRQDKPIEKYPERPSTKEVRPAYEPSQASNQAMYSGSYRPSLHENVQYPIPGFRQQSTHSSPWQQERDKGLSGTIKKEEDRRDLSRMPKFEPRTDSNIGPKRLGSPRKSRSPIRRERSPHDRYRKHSGSPRSSRSPRRSWALEKRRSPDVREAPPPPIWPGQQGPREDNPYRQGRPSFPTGKPKQTPVWEPRFDDKIDRRDRRPEIEERRFTEMRVRTDLGGRVLPPAGHSAPSPRSRDFKPDERFPPRDPKFEPREPKFEPRREPKFDPREEFSRGDDFRRQDMEKRYDRPDFRDESQRPDDDYRSKDNRPRHFEPKREEFPRREEYPRRDEVRPLIKAQETFQKEFDDIYKRAQEFREKAEELRRKEEHHDRHEADRRETRDDRRQREDDSRSDSRFDARQLRRPIEDSGKREAEWKVEEEKRHALKAKKDKAIEEIAEKMIHKFGCDWSTDIKKRVMEELRLSLGKILKDMFGVADVSFIEMVVKFNAKFDTKSQAKIFDDVMSSFPSHYRTMKRLAEEPVRADIPPKSARRTPDVNRDVANTVTEPQLVSNWMSLQQNLQMMMPQFDMVQPMIPQMPMMMQTIMPSSYMPSFEEVTAQQPVAKMSGYDNNALNEDGFNLYLCKDDFEPYTDIQAEYLKKFLVSQIVKTSATGWSPDFTIKGLQSMYRYELLTRDENTRDWIVNLDFTEFQLFNVLVYTKEELWYERAAIWLPGHSKCRNIEPLAKLKLQNKKLEGVNIGKWKFVKKIITPKGTRVYVDMPPSSARALEKHNMMLSYELQKVNVFLKAVAVDKDVFDAGMRVISVRDQSEIIQAAQNASMPSLMQEKYMVKIGLKGNKALNVDQARKVKDMLIYHIFKYHQEQGNSRTDFTKYGFCRPGYFGVVPENNESKRWLLSVNIGKINKHQIVILSSDENKCKFITMFVSVRNDGSLSTALPLILERLKQSNQGVKGLNFNLWKPIKVTPVRDNRTKCVLEVKMDIESIETIIKLKYKLDYVDERHNQVGNYVANVTSEYSPSKLEEKIKKYKDELNDSYDVANMEIASSDDDEDIVFVGEIK